MRTVPPSTDEARREKRRETLERHLKKWSPLYALAVIGVWTGILASGNAYSNGRMAELQETSENIIATTVDVSSGTDTIRQRVHTEVRNGACVATIQTYKRANNEGFYMEPPQVSVMPCTKPEGA